MGGSILTISCTEGDFLSCLSYLNSIPKPHIFLRCLEVEPWYTCIIVNGSVAADVTRSECWGGDSLKNSRSCFDFLASCLLQTCPNSGPGCLSYWVCACLIAIHVGV
ncbi:UNVERIFIED_CONTAM: hypothetical protein K2H54_032439 [Gekko kuhli]